MFHVTYGKRDGPSISKIVMCAAQKCQDVEMKSRKSHPSRTSRRMASSESLYLACLQPCKSLLKGLSRK